MSDLPPLPENVDRLSVSDLQARYGIKSGALYERFKVLGIERKGSGRPAYLACEQTKLMDELHLHLERGGRFADFSFTGQQNSGEIESVDRKELSSQSLRAFSSGVAAFLRVDVLDTVSGVLIKIGITIFPPPLPPAKRGLELSYCRELEEAYRGGWQLSSENLANLLGLTSKTVTNYGDRFEDAGFAFSRIGKRKGGQIAWLVSKPNLVDTTTLD